MSEQHVLTQLRQIRRALAVPCDFLRIGPVRPRGGIRLEKTTMSTFVIQNDEEFDLVFEPINKVGEPAPVDGVPVWGAIPEGVATLVPSDDGMLCTVKSISGVVGSCTVEVVADADRGEGFKPLKDSANVVIDQSDAEGSSMKASEPRART